MLTFRKITDIDPVVTYLAEVLETHLAADERVLWLVPGGSSITIAAEVSKKLDRKLLKNLAVTLTDERYGPVSHPDSNWRQLEEVGFALPGAALVPVLTGQDMENTVTRFANLLQKLFDNAEYSVGFFGIGPDGHTAGILPDSPAVTEMTLAAGYDAGNFKRITMTPPAIAKLDEAIVYAIGESKWPVLNQLESDMPLNEQPAQALKQVPRLTIFNDHLGEAAS
jgi:6-phosphogluconolactonase/glucosamine-6-phosphate isomerase/deaminase